MASEIEIEVQKQGPGNVLQGAAGLPVDNSEGGEAQRDDVYTAAAYGDFEKLQRLVEHEGCTVRVPDGGGYYALQWSALNNRTAVAQYLLEVFPWSPLAEMFARLSSGLKQA